MLNESSTILDAVQVLYNLSCCDRKILRCRDRKIIIVPYNSNPNCSNITVPTGERKKITNKVHKSGGNEGTVDSRNANKCNVLPVVYKGTEMKGVVGFKIANNRNGLACSDSNLYWMSGTVVDVGLLLLLSTMARYMVEWMKFTKRVPEVIDKEGADADSRVPKTAMCCEK